MEILIKIQSELKCPKGSHNSEYFCDKKGNIYSFRYGKMKLIKPILKKNGYFSVGINGKTIMIHRIIAKTLIDNPFNKLEVNHKNGTKTDNNIENLEWVTSSENTQHYLSMGYKPKHDETVFKFKHKITNEIFEGSIYDLRKKHNLPHQHFNKLKKGEINSLYNFQIIK
jgi:hypothetical protein